jgi:ribosomal protein S18 acetylase RimI-like enzyme
MTTDGVGLNRNPAVRLAAPHDRDRIVDLLTRAFADDPAMSFIFPDPVERARRLPRLFRLLHDSDARGGMLLLTEGGEAATLWRAPGQAQSATLTMLRVLIPLLGAFGSAIGRGMAVGNAIDAHFPKDDFWYLHIAGCDPAAQGRGFGGAAIRAGLDRAGATPAYLETATEANLGLYQRLGFNVTGEWHVPKGGPKFWSMRREAGAG